MLGEQDEVYPIKNRVLAHRGHWITPTEKNSVIALRRALEGGFGIETDIRDLDGELVISHDPPLSGSAPQSFASFLDLYRSLGSTGWLALNIKADGLAPKVKAELEAFEVANAFVFDMSVPDMRGYLSEDLITFTRMSDVEPSPSYYEASKGVWLDCFEIPYSPVEWVQKAMSDGKFAALVSPELHRRDYLAAWTAWRDAFRLDREPLVMICTDEPVKALEFFGDAT
jgi:hypothetical protein